MPIQIRRAAVTFMTFNKEQAKARRNELMRLSKAVKMNSAGQFKTVNEALLHFYREESGASVFNTRSQWKRQGYDIKTPYEQSSYLLWSAPKKFKKQDGQSDGDKIYFPICYIYSDKQVEKEQVTNSSRGGGQDEPIS
jgi:hypothetical protein